MQYTEFGKTGCRVSTLGFGAMRFPTLEKDGKKIIDEEKAIELIRHAIDSGVNYVDTAYFYHDGESERLDTLLNLFEKGVIDKKQLVSRLPDGIITDKKQLLNEIIAGGEHDEGI